MLNYDTLLSPNPLVESALVDETMVVVAVFPERDSIWLLPYITVGENKTKSPDRKPLEFELSCIESAIQNGDLVTEQLQLAAYQDVPEEYLLDRDGNKIPSAVERDRRYEIVKKALSYEDELFYPLHGKGVIAKVAKEFKVTRHNVQRYLNEYFRGGRHINSLIPKTGRHSTAPGQDAKKIGAARSTEILGIVGKNVGPTDLKNICTIAKKHYVNKKGKSLQWCFKALLDEHYALIKGKILQDGSRIKTVHVPENEQISFGQFYYWLPIVLGMSRNEIKAKRRQYATHKSNFAGRTGEVAYNSLGPGQAFQLDSTELDIVIVSPYDRRVSLKKVTLYVVRDVYTRAIVGIHVASGKASWYEARLALLNAFRDKVLVAKECGLTIEASDWIESGVPQVLLVDNEEFANKISASVGRDLGLIVQFSRAYSGDDKGLVESSFHMLHAMMRNEELAGFQYKGLLGRNRQLPRTTAALTPRDLQQILIIFAIYHNRCVWKDDYPLEQAAAFDGVKEVCRDYWIWGIKNRPYYLTQKPLRTLYLSLLEVGELTLHKTHLMLKGTHIKYRCDDVRVARLQDKAEGRAKKPSLRCRYIRSTVDKILIELDGKLVIGELHSCQQQFQGLSHAEFQAAWKMRKVRKDMHLHEVSGERSDTSLLIRHINSEAIKTRDNFIEQADAAPTIDTKTATQLQISDSYQIDNEMLDRATKPQASVSVVNSIAVTLPEDSAGAASPLEVTPNDTSVDILDAILLEMNHG
ncbi:hypothetical protein [Rheinheimera sp. 1928-s]|uniref:integrase catalytic domain-containing protein n=1 Tax=Rheinheimera sp. 1928-s TaxID=3033803 RepID=UPI0026230361|nr:hypothetical protein [Rheinheimera sp. 1928-s]MDF3123494.1 hypothetical protein [Rheinheimera sp. 1928-s]